MGPFQVLSSLPGAEVTFVAEKAGPVRDESGFLTVTAQAAFDDLPDPDILLVGGGTITGTLVPHHPIVGWIATRPPEDHVDHVRVYRGRCSWPAPAC
jgi:putative intracellular protease/amidase